VPKSRCIPLGFSLDTVGPMARGAEDCALLLQVLSGHAPSDPASAREPVPDYRAALTGDLTGIRVGVERAHHGVDVGTDPGVVRRLEDALSVLEDAGARVEEVSVDHWDEFADAALVIMHSEAFAFHRPNLRDHWGDYGSFTRVLLAHGAFLSAADYVQAQRVRALARAEVARIHERVDVIVSPTVGVPAPRLDADFLALMPLFFTGVWNVTGSPALSLPVEPERGLPVGMQLIGRPFDEATTLRVGDAYQRRTAWHRREPVELGSVPADGGAGA
jgi:aspartyl-tRNA(Asn)/glutamyl-tRNA(Gln) amidotransferase subunit A